MVYGIEDSPRGGVKKEYGANITLVVKRQGEADVSLKTKGNFPLRRVLLDYCRQKALTYEVIRFTFDGTRIRGYQTPDELEMEDGFIIDAWTDQIGGGHF